MVCVEDIVSHIEDAKALIDDATHNIEATKAHIVPVQHAQRLQ